MLFMLSVKQNLTNLHWVEEEEHDEKGYRGAQGQTHGLTNIILSDYYHIIKCFSQDKGVGTLQVGGGGYPIHTTNQKS